MNRLDAHAILNAAKAGQFVSRRDIKSALRATGDALPTEVTRFVTGDPLPKGSNMKSKSLCNFGKQWDDQDREILKQRWPTLGNDGVIPLLTVVRSPRSVENEAYRLGLKRLDEAGNRVYGGGRKKIPQKQKNMDRSLVLAPEASFGFIETGPVKSVWDLASAIGEQP